VGSAGEGVAPERLTDLLVEMKDPPADRIMSNAMEAVREYSWRERQHLLACPWQFVPGGYLIDPTAPRPGTPARGASYLGIPVTVCSPHYLYFPIQRLARNSR
jgi:hypothetical protein